MTNFEKRFKILPAGVVSKKLIGDRKIAFAILSCNFLEAYNVYILVSVHDHDIVQIGNHQKPFLPWGKNSLGFR